MVNLVVLVFTTLAKVCPMTVDMKMRIVRCSISVGKNYVLCLFPS